MATLRHYIKTRFLASTVPHMSTDNHWTRLV